MYINVVTNDRSGSAWLAVGKEWSYGCVSGCVYECVYNIPFCLYLSISLHRNPLGFGMKQREDDDCTSLEAWER